MKNVSHQNQWNTCTVQVQVGPPPIPLIKSKNDDKSDKYFIKIKLRGDLMSETSGLYEFKIALFDSSRPEEFLLFIQNSDVNTEASGRPKAGAKIQ